MRNVQLLFIAVIGIYLTLGFDAVALESQMSCPDLLFGDGSYRGCRDYTGKEWTVASAGADCGDMAGAAGGRFTAENNCGDYDEAIGSCVLDRDTGQETKLYFYGGEADMLASACLRFMGGEWEPSATISCHHREIVGSSNFEEVSVCTEYTGSNWDSASAAQDCSAKTAGTFNSGENCASFTALGQCVLNQEASNELKVYYYSGNSADLELNCRNMQGGIWTALDRRDNILQTAATALESDLNLVVTPERCDNAKLDELIENKQAIEFAPVNYSGTSGLIIYPGQQIDPRAYAVAARMIAEKGFLVAIVPFPGGLVGSDPMRADHIIMSHPEITDWAIAGHSQGGDSAAAYAAADPHGKIRAVAWWAAYPSKASNLSRTGLKGLSIRATLDGVIDPKAWNAAIARLPKATYIVDLYGGNHAQFGYYGDHQGDYPAKINRAYQHELFTGATVHLLNRMNVPDIKDTVSRLYARLNPATEAWGKDAQKIIAGLRFRDLRKRDILNEIIDEQEDFQKSKPSFSDQRTGLVNIRTHPHQIANPFDISLPPVIIGDLWIKMKSQAAFVDHYGLQPEDKTPSGCGQINQAVFEYALRNLDWQTYFKFGQAGVTLEYAEDFKATTGPGWLNQAVVLENRGRNTYTLKASRLEVSTDSPAPYGGNFYCKIWSPAAALKFILEQAN